MSTTLLCLLFAALPEISNVDWNSEPGSRFLSLRPGTIDSAGSAWFIQNRSNQPDAGEAYFGTYSYGEKNGFPKLRVDFCRRWVKRADDFGNQNWVFDTKYYTDDDGRYGATLEVTKTASGLTLSVLELSSTSRGGETVGKDPTPDHNHFRAGEILKMKQVTSQPFFADDTPPGYIARAKWKRNIKSNPSGTIGARLLSNNWYGWVRDTQSNRGETFVWVALHAGEKWHDGDAWLLCARERDGKPQLAAGRGTFEVTGHSNALLETLVLKLSLPRCYTAKTDGQSEIQWKVMNEDSPGLLLQPCGLNFHIPLADRSITSSDQRFYIDNVFYVDESGRHQRRTYSTGFLNLNTKVDVPDVFGAFREGTALSLVCGKPKLDGSNRAKSEERLIQLIEQSPPPGFEPPPRETTHTVARPELPGAADERLKLADAAVEEKKYALAVKGYDGILTQDAKNVGVLNSLAWILATAPDADVRDGDRALDLAMEACRLTDYKNCLYIDTLAAAAAETGSFSIAVKWQMDAVRLAPDKDKADYESRVQLYKNRRPYRLP